jgi:hypothetical protein
LDHQEALEGLGLGLNYRDRGVINWTVRKSRLLNLHR